MRSSITENYLYFIWFYFLLQSAVCQKEDRDNVGRYHELILFLFYFEFEVESAIDCRSSSDIQFLELSSLQSSTAH